MVGAHVFPRLAMVFVNGFCQGHNCVLHPPQMWWVNMVSTHKVCGRDGVKDVYAST